MPLVIETRPSSSVHVEPSLGRWEKKRGVGIPTCLCKRDVAVGFYLGWVVQKRLEKQ